MRWLAALCVLIGVSCAGRTAHNEEPLPPRDLDLLCGAAAGACEEAWDALEGLDVGMVLIERVGSDVGSWLVEEELSRGLLDRGWQVGKPGGAGAGSDTARVGDYVRLTYRVVGMHVRYRPLGRGFWRSTRVGRHAEVELAFRLENEQLGRLLWVGRGTGEARDTVQRSTLSAVAHPEFSPSPDDWPQSRPWVIEAAVASGLIGLILAVFYAGTV